MNKRALAVVVAIVVVIIIVAGVEVGLYYTHKPSIAKPVEHTLIIASSQTPASIDPAVAFDTYSVFFDDQIYRPFWDTEQRQ